MRREQRAQHMGDVVLVQARGACGLELAVQVALALAFAAGARDLTLPYEEQRAGLQLPESYCEAAPLVEMERQIESLRQQIRATDDEMDRLEHEIEQVFNPYFGPLLKAAAENSRFGQQVEDFACVYTSRVSNFLQYAPFQHFRSPRDHLPHERVY